MLEPDRLVGCAIGRHGSDLIGQGGPVVAQGRHGRDRAILIVLRREVGVAAAGRRVGLVIIRAGGRLPFAVHDATVPGAGAVGDPGMGIVLGAADLAAARSRAGAVGGGMAVAGCRTAGLLGIAIVPGRAGPAAIVEMIGQTVGRAAAMHAGTDKAFGGAARCNSVDATAGIVGTAVAVVGGIGVAEIAHAVGIGAGIAGTEGFKRPAIEFAVAVGLMGVVDLVGDRRLAPIRPVDPAGADIGGADIDHLDEGHNGHLHVSGGGRRILQGGQQLLGGILQRGHLGTAG